MSKYQLSVRILGEYQLSVNPSRPSAQKQTNKQRKRERERQTDRQTGRQTDRQRATNENCQYYIIESNKPID